MKKLSVKILFVTLFVLGISMLLSFFYVVRYEKKMMLEEAYSTGDGPDPAFIGHGRGQAGQGDP